MNTALALKIERELGLTEGFFMILQIFYEIRQEKRKLMEDIHPDFSKFRRGLFWHTVMRRTESNPGEFHRFHHGG